MELPPLPISRQPKKSQDYLLVTALLYTKHRQDSLEAKVNGLLSEGWVLVGGPMVIHDIRQILNGDVKATISIAQAMIKEENI